MGGFADLIQGGISAAGQMASGKQSAADAETNKAAAELMAQDALRRGTVEETRYRREIAAIIGAQRAEFGARNVTVSGTALDLLGDTAMIGEEDAVTIRNNAAREAWGFRNDASNYGRAAKSFRQNSYYQAGNTLLTSGSNAYGQWRQDSYNRGGGGGGGRSGGGYGGGGSESGGRRGMTGPT